MSINVTFGCKCVIHLGLKFKLNQPVSISVYESLFFKSLHVYEIITFHLSFKKTEIFYHTQNKNKKLLFILGSPDTSDHLAGRNVGQSCNGNTKTQENVE